MVSKTLDPKKIKAGEQLIRRLDDKGLRPDAAFWFYRSDPGEWTLVIAEAKVKSKGPKEVYKQLQKYMSQLSDESQSALSLYDLSIATPDAPLVQLLKRAVRTGPGLSGIRFSNNVIDGTVIEDAYIYRLR